MRTLQLVCLIDSAPNHHLHDKKKTFKISDKSTKKVKLKVTVLIVPWFPPNWITTCWDVSSVLRFNLMSLGHVLVKLLSMRSQVNILHQTARTTMHAKLHCSCSKRAPSLSWAILYFSLVILDTCPTLWTSWKFFKMYVTCLVEPAFPAAGSVLC